MAGEPAAGGTGEPTRRGFLRAAGAVAGAGALAACTRTVAPPGPAATRSAGAAAARLPSPTATAPASPAAADWQALQRGLSSGRLLRPGQSGYHTARLLFDPRFDYLRPAGVAYCRTPADVALCLSFVRRFALPVAARSGGHSYGGWSGSTGLVVDVTEMNSFRLLPGGHSVTVGTGSHLIDLYRKLSGHGLAVPGGSCPTVGVAGLTLGGGVGVVGRAFGLSCDNLEAMQIVTADGSVLDIDGAHHSDLFWACRGGGGGNFGVATSFAFRTHPLSSLVLFFLSWPWSQAERVIAGWQSWAPQAPDALWSNVHLSAAPGGSTPSIQVGGTYLGSVSGLTALLDQLYAAVGSGPVSPFVQDTPYLQAMLLDAGCSGLTVDQCHLPWQAPGGQLTRQPSYAKSDFFTVKLPRAGIRALLAGVEALTGVPGASSGAGGVAFDAFGGALNRVPADATAFVHRDALFLAQYTTEWGAGATAGQVASQHRWLRKFYASMRPYASGQCYQNYADPDLANWRQAYYGANYPRLAHVKGLYDPGQLFRFAQGITPGP
ncbi:MAG TPA: FAD-binding oxidoreductase [Streptosporangiaceae bacterium]